MLVVWTEEAFHRLADIEDYIAQDDPGAARGWTDRLLKRAETLADFPNMGRRLPELPDSPLRELLEGSYRIVYRLRGEVVEVLTVFEAHRCLPEDELP